MLVKLEPNKIYYVITKEAATRKKIMVLAYLGINDQVHVLYMKMGKNIAVRHLTIKCSGEVHELMGLLDAKGMSVITIVEVENNEVANHIRSLIAKINIEDTIDLRVLSGDDTFEYQEYYIVDEQSDSKDIVYIISKKRSDQDIYEMIKFNLRDGLIKEFYTVYGDMRPFNVIDILKGHGVKVGSIYGFIDDTMKENINMMLLEAYRRQDGQAVIGHRVVMTEDGEC